MSKLYAGFDLTDPYARTPRAIDVALIQEEPEALGVSFEQVTWDGFLDAMQDFANAFVERFRQASTWVIDGPFGLAIPQANSRVCEQQLRAPGRTPDNLPEPGARPFAGYIRGSVLFVRHLLATGTVDLVNGLSENRDIQSLEAYPGSAWPVLAGGRLPSKSTLAGRKARVQLLQDCGIQLPHDVLPTHDQLDAALCAYLGYLWRRGNGAVAFVGNEIFADADALREGQIVQPIHVADNWPRKELLRVPPRSKPPRISTTQESEVQGKGGGPRKPPEERLQAGGRPPEGINPHDWVYFATPAGANRFDTVELAHDFGLIHRTVFNLAHPPARIANVQHLEPGQSILLCFGENNDYRAVASCTLSTPDNRVEHEDSLFPAFDFADVAEAGRLKESGYPPDPVLQSYTVLRVDAQYVEGEPVVHRPPGQNAIRNWGDVFAG